MQLEDPQEDNTEGADALGRPLLSRVGTDIARSIQFHASRRDDHFAEVRLAVVAQGAAYSCQGLDRQGDESGIPQGGY